MRVRQAGRRPKFHGGFSASRISFLRPPGGVQTMGRAIVRTWGLRLIGRCVFQRTDHAHRSTPVCPSALQLPGGDAGLRVISDITNSTRRRS